MFANTLKNAFQKRYPVKGGMGGPYDSFVFDPNKMYQTLQGQQDAGNLDTFKEELQSLPNNYLDNAQYQSGTGTIQPQPQPVNQLYNVAERPSAEQRPYAQQPIAKKKVDFGGKVFKNGKYSKSNAAKELGISKSELSRRAKEKGFKSTEEYYNWKMSRRSQPQQPTAPTYMDDSGFAGFLDTLRNAFSVQPVYAQTNDVTGSSVNMGNQPLGQSGPSLGERFGNWFGNLPIKERGFSEILGGQTGSIGNTAPEASNYGSLYTSVLPQALNYADGEGLLNTGYTPAGSYATPTDNGIAFDSASDPTIAQANIGTINPDIQGARSTEQGVEYPPSQTQTPVPTQEGEVQDTYTQQPAQSPGYSTGIQNEYSDILGGFDAGQTGEDLLNQLNPIFEDMQQQVEAGAETDKSRLEAQYAYLQQNYANMTDEAKQQADLAMREIRDTLDSAYGTAQESRARLGRTYEDLIKSRVRQGKASEQKLRNMFSSLGTADSSAFIEAMAAGEQGLGSDIAGIQQEEVLGNQQIDRYLRDLEADKSRNIAQIQLNLQSQQNNIMNNQMLSTQQKQIAMEQLQQDAMSAMSDLNMQQMNMRMQIPLQLAGLEAQIIGSLGSSYPDYFTPDRSASSIYDTPQVSPAQGEGSTMRGQDGRWYVFRNGRWELQS